MADLDNLLDDDINNDEDDLDQQQQELPYDGEDVDADDNVERSERSRVPAALAAAAAERRRLDNTDDLGAGDEERDYQAQGGAQGGRHAEEGDGDVDGEFDDGEDDRNYNPDYEQLKGIWTAELACPELLPHDAETIVQNVEELANKEDVIEELLQRSRQQSQRQSSRETAGELASLVAQITKMDADRTRFMLVDLARTRMAKIENHALHNRTLVDRMTEEELSYLRQYGELLEKHYKRTVLNQLPKEAYKKLDDDEMIDSPDLEQFIFCRVVENVQIDVSGETKIIDQEYEQDDEDEDYGDNIQEHAAGSYLIVMYKQIRDLVLEGKVELLM